MNEAHDLIELKKRISQLNLRDNRRDLPRYKMDILGHYYIEQGGLRGILDTCLLVDACKRGIAIKIKSTKFQKGMLLHLQFPAGLNLVNIVGKAVYIDREDDGYLVGVQSLNKKFDVINQLLS